MGKHQQLAKPRPRKPLKAPKETPAESSGPTENRIADVLEAELQRIEAIQESLTRTLAAGEATPALVRESNGLGGALAKVSAELRQRDKHREQAVIDLPPEEEDAIVRDFLDDISPARRAAFRVHLAEEDAADQLLGHG